MCRWRPWPLASLALLLAPASAAAAQAAPATDTTVAPATAAVLALVVDGRALDEPVAVRRVGADVSVRAADLRGAGLTVADGADWVSLASIVGLRFSIDEARQVLAIRTGAPVVVAASDRGGAASGPLTASGWGGFLNYDATLYAGAWGRGSGATLDGALFTPRGYAFAGAIVTDDRGRRARIARTDIGYMLTSPDWMLRATIGDFVNGASSTSRPIRMAGLRIGTDFGTRPDLVTFPLPAIAGVAAVASSVDLVVNGDRRPVGEVGAGPFAVSDVPVQTGINTVAVAVRDALGRQSVRTVTAYASRDLLRPGLSAFSAEAGWVRAGYLSDHDRYRALAATGTWRRGMSGWWTLEGHAEGSAEVATGSVGGLFNLGRLGLASGSLAIGRAGEGRSGVAAQWSAGLQRIDKPVSVSVRYITNGRGWRDLAATYGSVTVTHSLQANVGFDLARYGTIGVGLLALGPGTSTDRYRGRLGPVLATPASTLLNATYAARLTQRIGLLATVGGDTLHRRSVFASLGATVVFGAKTSGYAGASGGAGGVVAGATVSRSAVVPGDWGYRADVAVGPVARVAGAVQHLGRAGLAEAEVQEVAGQAAARLSARGSIVAIGGHAFLAETMTDSFAMVDSAGQPGVAIYRDHHRVGVTDDRGLLIVPNLPAFQGTTFSIDPAMLDPSLVVGRTEAAVRPGEHVGVRLSFDIAADRSVLLTLVDEAGRPLPAGAHGRFGDAEVPIGFDGQAYLTPGPGGAMIVDLPAGRRCVVTVPARAAIVGRTASARCLTRTVATS